MKTFTLTASDGVTTAHHLAEGWADVSVAAFVQHQTAVNKLRPARALVARAALLSDVPEAILKSDVSIAARIVGACTWLSDLPTATGEPVQAFEHRGIRYRHVGNLDVISAGQLEALLVFLRDADEEPVAAFPNLLAVLYCPDGREQTPETVAAAAEAFLSLPIATAWPALSNFMTAGAPCALRIQQYSVAHRAAEQAVQTLRSLTEARTDGGSPGFLRRWQARAVAHWIPFAEKLLSTSST